MNKKLIGPFPYTVKPARVGVYAWAAKWSRTKYWYRYFDGKRWFPGDRTPDGADLWGVVSKPLRQEQLHTESWYGQPAK